MNNDTFTKSYDYVILDDDKRMTKAMKEVYCYLLRFKEAGNDAFPSVSNIMKHTLNSDSTVRRATKALEDIGLIKKVHRLNMSNIYLIQPYDKKLNPCLPDSTCHTDSTPCLSDSTPCLTDIPYMSERTSIRLEDEIRDKITYKKEQEENDQAFIEESKVEMNPPLSFSSASQKLSDSIAAPDNNYGLTVQRKSNLFPIHSANDFQFDQYGDY